MASETMDGHGFNTQMNNSLEFVLIEHPTDTRTGSLRKQIRSHVTRVQHQRSKQNRARSNTAAPSLRNSVIGHSVETPPKSPYAWDRRRKHLMRQEKVEAGTPRAMVPAGVNDSGSGARRPQPSQKESVSLADGAARLPVEGATETGGVVREKEAREKEQQQQQQEEEEQDVEEVEEQDVEEVEEPSSNDHALELASGSLGSSFSSGVMAARTFLLHDPTNTVGVSLKHLRMDLSSVLGFYEVIVKFQSQDFGVKMPVTKPSSISLHARFLQFIFTDPALIIAAVLLTVNYLFGSCIAPTRHGDSHHLLHLRGILIRTINAALDEPTRCLSDQMLVAVALAAAYEVSYGTMQGYNAHMSGLLEMIRIRGGLAMIGLSDPFVERFLLWHMANTGLLAGSDRYYQTISKTSVVAVCPQPDATMFRATGLSVK